MPDSTVPALDISGSDVVVVGGGGSGLAAAISAAEHGARVVVLEKGSELRGSTGRSVGSIAASGTPDQERKGIVDDADAHLRDYRTLSGSLTDTEDIALARLLTHNVTDTLVWLREMGMEFFGPVGEPPHSAPRLHNVLPGSRSYIYHLERRARVLGVRIVLDCPVTRLEVEDGRVTGVVAHHGGREMQVQASRGVILAAGDFSAGRDLKARWINEQVAEFVPVNPHATGDAQTMALELGGQVLNADVFDVPSMRLAPPPSDGLFGLLQKLPPRRILTRTVRWGLDHLPDRMIRTLMMGFVTTYLSPREAMFDEGALLVDASGDLRSGTDENINLTVASLGEAGGYIIGDRALYEKFSTDPYHVATAPGVAFAYMPDFRRARPDVYAEAPTLESLADRIGVPAEHLTKSAAAAGTLNGQAPYFALGPVRAYLLQTNGGLAIDSELRVVGSDGTSIPGLFAVGNAGQGGLALFGHGHHLGWAFTSGRLAGRIAAGAQTGSVASATRS